MFKYQRSYQKSVQELEDLILTPGSDGYLGVFRIRLENLYFDEAFVLSNLNKNNVRRLKRIFATEGCLRLQPQYHVFAVISPEDFTRAFDASNLAGDEVHQRLENFPELLLPSRFKLRCLHGLHRLQAANDFLRNADRWWTVELFSQDAHPKLLMALEETFSNSITPSDGRIYRAIRGYQATNQEEEERRWWARLSRDKQRYLRMVLRRPQLREIFDRISTIPALAEGLHLGLLHKVVAVRCDEEIIHYGEKILSFWHDLFANHKAALTRIDAQSVDLVQGTCALLSKADLEQLQKHFDEGTLFPHLRTDERTDVFQRLVERDILVPTLHTFFKDLQLITLCQKVLKILLPAHALDNGETMRDGFISIFSIGESGPVPYQVSEAKTRNSAEHLSSTDRFSHGYQQLWLFALRHWSFIVEERPRLGTKGQKRTDKEIFSPKIASRRISWLAHAAQDYGFVCDELEALVNIRHLPGFDSKASTATPAFTSDQEPSAWRHRHGIPWQDEIAKDMSYLFWDNVHTSANGQSPNTSVTSFYLRRNFFRMLFSTNDADVTTYEPQIGPLVPQNSQRQTQPAGFSTNTRKRTRPTSSTRFSSVDVDDVVNIYASIPSPIAQIGRLNWPTGSRDRIDGRTPLPLPSPQLGTDNSQETHPEAISNSLVPQSTYSVVHYSGDINHQETTSDSPNHLKRQSSSHYSQGPSEVDATDKRNPYSQKRPRLSDNPDPTEPQLRVRLFGGRSRTTYIPFDRNSVIEFCRDWGESHPMIFVNRQRYRFDQVWDILEKSKPEEIMMVSVNGHRAYIDYTKLLQFPSDQLLLPPPRTDQNIPENDNKDDLGEII